VRAEIMMKIVTHSGTAHADEIMAIALILQHTCTPLDEVEIERVSECDPVAARADYINKIYDLAQFNGFYVVDVGKVYDPSMDFFDHHQFPADAPPDCAFSLVAKAFGYTEKEFPWMERLSFVDSKGPYAYFEHKMGRKHASHREVAELLGTDSVFDYFPRIANRSSDSMAAYKKAVEMAAGWLEMEIDWITKKKKNVEYAQKNLRVVDFGDYKMAFFDQKEVKGTLEIADAMAEADPSVFLVGKLDDRGDGFSAMRMADHPRVDFSPRKGEKGCVFAHNNGFVLKWANDWAGFLDAIRKSVKPAK
jgi:hypothetical protein